MNSRNDKTKNEYSKIAQEWLDFDCVFIDTETTGLEGDDEIVEIAIIETNGEILLNSLVMPTVPIQPGAERVHRISKALLVERKAPPISELWPKILETLNGRHVVAYNAGFDIPKIRQSIFADSRSRVAGTDKPAIFQHTWPEFESHCAMLLYADFCGDWDEYHGNNRWHPLWKAVRRFGITIGDDLHRALADAEACRQVVIEMAEWKDEE